MSLEEESARVAKHLARLDSCNLKVRDARNDLAEGTIPILDWVLRIAVMFRMHEIICPGKSTAFLSLVADWTWPSNGDLRPQGELWLVCEDVDGNVVDKACLREEAPPIGSDQSDLQAWLTGNDVEAFLEYLEGQTGLRPYDFRAIAEAHLKHPDNASEMCLIGCLEIAPEEEGGSTNLTFPPYD